MRDATLTPDTSQLASDIKSAIRNRQSALAAESDLLKVFSLESYLSAARTRNPYKFAVALPRSQEEMLRRIRKKYDAAVISQWNWLALLRAIEQRLDEEEFRKLPLGVQKICLEWFERILAESRSDESNCDVMSADDSFQWEKCTDFAVGTGRILPVGGAWIVEQKRISRDALFAKQSSAPEATQDKSEHFSRSIRRRIVETLANTRLYDFARGALFRYREATGRYDSYLVIHTAIHYRRWFSDRFQRVAFQNIAALLANESSLIGLYRRGWLLDPQIAEMDPRLAFLTEIPVENGARYGFAGAVDSENCKKILKFSRVRRENYESGDYRPQEWAYFWSRDAIAKWIESQ